MGLAPLVGPAPKPSVDGTMPWDEVPPTTVWTRTAYVLLVKRKRLAPHADGPLVYSTTRVLALSDRGKVRGSPDRAPRFIGFMAVRFPLLPVWPR